jgi:F0F1-type ATP synthase assembly protein I
VIVVFPILLLYLGKLLDEFMGTSPYFMLGLFFLALLTGIGRFYKEAWSRHKGV